MDEVTSWLYNIERVIMSFEPKDKIIIAAMVFVLWVFISLIVYYIDETRG